MYDLLSKGPILPVTFLLFLDGHRYYLHISGKPHHSGQQKAFLCLDLQGRKQVEPRFTQVAVLSHSAAQPGAMGSMSQGNKLRCQKGRS